MALPSEIACPAALGLAAGATYAVTPLAMAVATRTSFFDHPVGYKAHRNPTPYLGGAALLCGFLLPALIFGGAATTYAAITGCALGLWALGTLDDRVTVAPRWRVLAEIAAAALLIEAGLGWSVSSVPLVDYALTVAWVLAVVNAFNLMDNLDGAASTVAAASSAGIAILSLIEGHTVIACFALAICGASLGFLPWNLAGPARIFLGDGGSMLLGFLVAAATMMLSHNQGTDAAAFPAGLLLVGLPAFDVMLVMYSRRRRRVSLISGGRDHLTHRLLRRMRSPRYVAVALALGQTLLVTMAIGGFELDRMAVWLLAAAGLIVGIAVIPLIERDRIATVQWSDNQVPREAAANAQAGARTPVGHASREASR
jgi:UDP-GlcNAc:undecaprenyl-phosphate GlcNAc-1-phosphate transferase